MASAKRYQYQLECIQCGVRFYSYHGKQKCCSHECRAEYAKSRIKLICEGCGKTFEVMPSIGFRKYCNRECYMEAHRKKEDHRIAKGDLIFTLDKLLDLGYDIKICGMCSRILRSDEDNLCARCNNYLTRDNKSGKVEK